jgi:hypothetical protein
MIFKVLGTSPHNAGVTFLSTPIATEADDLAVFDEEHNVWRWCDTSTQTEHQRMIARMARKTHLLTCGKSVEIRAPADYLYALSTCLYRQSIPLAEEEVAANVNRLWLTWCYTPNGAKHYVTKVDAKSGDPQHGYIVLNDDRVVDVYPVRIQFEDGAGTMWLFFHRPDLRPEDMGKPDQSYAAMKLQAMVA